ncbi:MAG: hypothetical protein IJN82_01025 [Clostridia bacterium]|nr:hypothetical protein [Clostridia bacterium]
MQRITALLILLILMVSLSACRRGELVQEVAGALPDGIGEKFEEEAEEEIVEEEAEKPPVKLECLDPETIPAELKALFEEHLDGKNLRYFTLEAAKKLEYRMAPGILNVAFAPMRYSYFFPKDEERLVAVGTVDAIRAVADKDIYVAMQVNELLHGDVAEDRVVVSRGISLESRENEEYFTDHSADTATLEQRLLPEEKRLYVLGESKYNAGVYYCRLSPIVLPTDYQDFDEEYVSELLDYYRGKQYENQEKKDPTKTESGEMIYHAVLNPYKEYKNYTDEQMMELLEDQLLVQIALRYKIKIWPQDNPMLAKLETD